MADLTSIIVYRNPLEAALWQSITVDSIGLLAIGMPVALVMAIIFAKVTEFVVNKMRWRVGNSVALASIVGIMFGYGLTFAFFMF